MKKIVIITLALMCGMVALSKYLYPPKSQYTLYLIDKASIFLSNEEIAPFENKVREVSKKLNIPPEWLMAVIYSESRFDAAAKNMKGTGLVGLTQIGPDWAGKHGLTTQQIREMDHVTQLEVVYTYFKEIRKEYGDYMSLTDLYLAILQKEAIGKDSTYPILTCCYLQNAGLDEDNNKIINVCDIDRRMQRVFRKACLAKIN